MTNKNLKFSVGTTHTTAQGKIEIVGTPVVDGVQMVEFRYFNHSDFSHDTILTNKLVNLRSNIAKYETRKMATSTKTVVDNSKVEQLERDLVEAYVEIEMLKAQIEELKASKVEVAPTVEVKTTEYIATKDGVEYGPCPNITKLAKLIGVDPAGLKRNYLNNKATKGFVVTEK